MTPKPTVGRIVHYIARHDGSTWAAIVTRDNRDGTVDLTAFPPGGQPPMPLEYVMHTTTGVPGSWSWPPRDT